MIANRSSKFYEILKLYGSGDVDSKFNRIKEFEKNFHNRQKLSEMEPISFQKFLSKSVEYIEEANEVLGHTEQLSIELKEKMERKKVEYSRQEFRVEKEAEELDFLKNNDLTKTEKVFAKKRAIEEQLFDLKNEVETLKMYYEFAKIYVEDAKRYRELTLSYYQAVKQITGM